MINQKYIILAIATFLASQIIRADEQTPGMFREDLRWNYLVESHYYEPYYVSRMKFDGVQEYEGMTYHRLVGDYYFWSNSHPSIFCREYKLDKGKAALLRQEGGKVFARLPDYWRRDYPEEKDYYREVQLYDINCREGETFESLSDEGEIVEMKVTKVEHLSVNGRSLRLLTVMPVKETSDPYEEGDFQILEDVGIVRGGCCLWFVLSPMPSGGPATNAPEILRYGRPIFHSLTTVEGEVLYSGKRREDDSYYVKVGDVYQASVGIEHEKEWEYATVQEIPSETKDEIKKKYTLSTYRVEGIDKVGDRIYSRLCLVGEKNWTMTLKGSDVYECSPVTETEKHECVARIRCDSWNLFMLPTEEIISYIKPPYTDFLTRPLSEGEELMLYPAEPKKGNVANLWFGYCALAEILDEKTVILENSIALTEIKIGNVKLPEYNGNTVSGSLVIDKTYLSGVGNTGLGTFWNPVPNDDLSQYGRYEPRIFFNNMYGNTTNSGDWGLIYEGAGISPENPGAVGGMISDNAGCDAPGAVYDLCGRRVLTGASESDLRNLPKGIYIHKGRKIII